VNGQTSIIGSNSVDIRTEKNTHVEGAVIAAENGNIKLDTGTLTYKDLQDKDTGSNTQVGVSVPLGSALWADASPAKPTTPKDTTAKTDSSPVTDFLMGSTLSGSYDAHDKRQVNRATIGEGTIIIRSDPAQGLAGLNRDLQKAQELTKDDTVKAMVYIDPGSLVSFLKLIEDALADKGSSIDLARMSMETLDKLVAQGIIPKERAEAIKHYSLLSKEEKALAESNLQTMLKLDSNQSQLGDFVKNMTLAERAAVCSAAMKDGATTEKYHVALVALYGEETYARVSDWKLGVSSDALNDPAQFLDPQTRNGAVELAEHTTTGLLKERGMLETALANYEAAGEGKDKLNALQGIVTILGKAFGIENVKVKLDERQGPIAFVTQRFVPGGWFSSDHMEDMETVYIVKDNKLYNGTNSARALDTLVHEMAHLVQTQMMERYITGGDKNPSAALFLANRSVYVAGNEHNGLYLAQPLEAYANTVAKNVMKSLEKAGVVK